MRDIERDNESWEGEMEREIISVNNWWWGLCVYVYVYPLIYHEHDMTQAPARKKSTAVDPDPSFFIYFFIYQSLLKIITIWLLQTIHIQKYYMTT